MSVLWFSWQEIYKFRLSYNEYTFLKAFNKMYLSQLREVQEQQKKNFKALNFLLGLYTILR